LNSKKEKLVFENYIIFVDDESSIPDFLIYSGVYIMDVI
jgi:hypothetical protein